MGSVRRILEGRLWVFASCSSTGKVVSLLQVNRDLYRTLVASALVVCKSCRRLPLTRHTRMCSGTVTPESSSAGDSLASSGVLLRLSCRLAGYKPCEP